MHRGMLVCWILLYSSMHGNFIFRELYFYSLLGLLKILLNFMSLDHAFYRITLFFFITSNFSNLEVCMSLNTWFDRLFPVIKSFILLLIPISVLSFFLYNQKDCFIWIWISLIPTAFSLQKLCLIMGEVSTNKHWKCWVQILMPITARYSYEPSACATKVSVDYCTEDRLIHFRDARWSGHQMSSSMFLMKSGSLCY